MALDTLANVKARLGVSDSSDDTLLGLLIDSADHWVAQWTGRDFAGGTFTEYFPGNVPTLQLANYPVTSVTSVKVDPAGVFGAESVIDASAYVLHAERGVIQSRVGPFVAVPRGPGLVNQDRHDWTRSPRAVQVVYATATSAVPHLVKEAFALLIGHWYRHVKTQSSAGHVNMQRQTLGDVTIALAAMPDRIPGEVPLLLAPYRTPVI